MTEAQLLNQNLEGKIANKFYVKFYGIEGNVSNFLAAHLISIDRPIVNFDVAEMYLKARRNQHHTNLRFNPVGLLFKDDVGGLVYDLVRDIAIRQNKHDIDSFEIEIQVLDNEYNIVDYYTMQRCVIQTLGKNPVAYIDATESLIDVTIAFESIGFKQS